MMTAPMTFRPPGTIADHVRRDPHAWLGLPRHARAAEINAAFRRRARAYHPDRSDPFLRETHAEIFRALCAARRRLLAGPS